MRARATAILAATAACLPALAAALAVAAPSAGAAPTSVSIGASVQPSRLGARAAASISLRFTGGTDGVPAPLRGVVLHLPEGVGVDLAGVGICQPARLRSRGASGCSSASLIGRGHALLKVHAGSQTLPEEATISVFRGPDRGTHHTFEILGHGETPLYENTLSTAVLEGDSAPYGSKLVVSIPAIPTLVYEPDASFSSLSLKIGAGAGGPHGAIILPRSCPREGFSYAADFAFADGSTASTSAQLPCA